MSMRSVFGQPHFTPARRFTAWLGLSVLLAGCQVTMLRTLPTLAEINDTSQFHSVALDKTWVYASGAVGVLERGIASFREQRIALQNLTTIPGDNVLLLQAFYVPGKEPGRFGYEQFLGRTGGLPEPFQATKSGDLLSGQDELGPYFWTEARFGDTAVCVLGLRHLNLGIRQLPSNTNQLDVMLRNCVNGTAQDALGPMSAANIQNYPDGTATTPFGSRRLLSPLAGAIPQP